MIPARKQPAFNFILRRWLARVLRRRFHAFRLAGGEHLRALPPNTPVVGCVNHTNWWDGFILYVLSHRLLPHDIHLAMEEKNLRRYRFFTWMGVFGIDLTDRRASLAGLRYAVRLLRQPGAPLVWMFVQGELLSSRRAVEVKPGATFLARQTGAILLPLVLRYEWLQESAPSILARAGAPLPADTTPDVLAIRLNALLAQTDADVETRNFAGYENVLPARMSLNKSWDRVVHLLLGRPEPFDRENG